MGWRKPSELVSGVCCEDTSCGNTTGDDMAACGRSGKKWLQLQTTYAYKGKEPLCPSRGPIVDRNDTIASCSVDGCAMHKAPATKKVLDPTISEADCKGKTANNMGDREWDAESGACYSEFPIPYVLNSSLTEKTQAAGAEDCENKCMDAADCIAFQFGPNEQQCTLATRLNPDSGAANKVWRSDIADDASASSVVGFKSCPPRANLNRLYVNATGSCPEEAEVGRFGFNAFHHGIDAAYETLQTQLEKKQGNKMGELFQWEQLGNDMGVWYKNKTVGECQSLCERSARCGEFYHDPEGDGRCMMFDGACHSIGTDHERKLYGMGTRISGAEGGVCSDDTLLSEDLCWGEGHEWHPNMYSSNLAIDLDVDGADACTNLCESECIYDHCRSLFMEDTRSCYCDATDIVLGEQDPTEYHHYVAPHPPTLPHVYQKTVGDGYTINDLASAEAACNAEKDDLGRPLTLCPKEAMHLQNECTFGYVRNERMPGMMVDDLKTHRDKMSAQNAATNAICESMESKQACEDEDSGMVNYETHKCIWGYDDQTGDFACRPAWWNMCGSEAGRWHSADKYNAAAHCCTQNE